MKQIIAEPFSKRVRNCRKKKKDMETRMAHSNNIKNEPDTDVHVFKNLPVKSNESPALKRKSIVECTSSPKQLRKNDQKKSILCLRSTKSKQTNCKDDENKIDENKIDENIKENFNISNKTNKEVTSNSFIQITKIKTVSEGFLQSLSIQKDFHKELSIRFVKKNKNLTQMKGLLKDSFNYRRNYMKNTQDLFLHLIEEFPYFKEPVLLQCEFEMILEKKINIITTEIEGIMKKLWQYYQITAKDEVSGYVNIISKLEKDLRSKKIKQESLIFTGKNLTDNKIEAPRLYIYLNRLCIVYKQEVLCEIEENIFERAISLLFSFYFIFDIKYPLVFVQILGFFHKIIFPFEEISLEENENFCKITKFLN